MQKSLISADSLNRGERVIEAAPRIRLRNGQSCIPQHYLTYNHNRETIEALVSDISFSERYPIFVSDDKGSLFIQIGIIGYDNYKQTDKQPGQKIVFGRRWRVEPNLPSSEIIQTVFLAIKKAREHEIRELFTLKLHKKTTTPFNNHHDLPLMARNKDILQAPAVTPPLVSLDEALSAIRFDGGEFTILESETLRSGMTALTVGFTPQIATDYTEFTREPFTLLLNSMDANTLYHSLIDTLISASDKFVDETFNYNGFARFSRNLDISAIADLSIQLRQAPQKLKRTDGEDYGFAKRFKNENYDTDVTRIPILTNSTYNQRLQKSLTEMKLTNFDMLRAAQNETA